MTFLLLYLLATIDCALCGYRAAAGKNALIDKRAYYQRVMLRAALLGQVSVAIAAVASGVAVLCSHNPPQLLSDFNQIGHRMLTVYLPYAVLILLAFAFRALPSVDLRSLTSVLVFGPLTLIRPLVAIAGVMWGLLAVPRPVAVGIGALVLVLMLSFEQILGRKFSRLQSLS